MSEAKIKNENSIDLQVIADKAVWEIGGDIINIVKELNGKLVEILKKETKCDIEIVDVGYDVSEHPYRTGKRFDIYNYSTVKDFLEEATGNTIATYISGAGLIAETYKDYFQDLIMRKKYDIAKEVFVRETGIDITNILIKENGVFDDFNDIFCDNSIEIEQQIFETFSYQKIYLIF